MIFSLFKQSGLAVLFVTGLTVAFSASSPASEPLRLEQPVPGEMLSAHFDLKGNTKLELEAVGLIQKHSEDFIAYAWILDCQSRRPVWTMVGQEWDCCQESRLLRHAKDMVSLGKGSYTVFYYAGDKYHGGAPFRDLSHLLNDLAEMLRAENPAKDLQKYLDKCYVSLNLPEDAVVTNHAPAPQHREPTLISLSCAQDNIFFARPFQIQRDTRIRLYVVGEAIWKGEFLADYAWIESATSGETVWLMDMPHSDHAGGAVKNRYFKGEIPLSSGEYYLSYITDDSHSCQLWNAPPPYDPNAWGVALLPGKGYQESDLIKLKHGDLKEDPRILVKMIHLRDDEHSIQEFQLDEPTHLHIYALGEGGQDEMWDTGWIEDLNKRQTVWRMYYRDTECAGGDKKNRLIDDVIKLGAGRYEAHFTTDGSHAFGTWNARPPREPHRWGMTIMVADR